MELERSDLAFVVEESQGFESKCQQSTINPTRTRGQCETEVSEPGALCRACPAALAYSEANNRTGICRVNCATTSGARRPVFHGVRKGKHNFGERLGKSRSLQYWRAGSIPSVLGPR